MSLFGQFFRFSLIGAAGFLVDLCVLYFLRNLGFDLYSARFFSFLAAATFTWLGNRLFTFGRAASMPVKVASEWSVYMAAMTFGGLINYAVYALLVTVLATFREHPWLAVVAGTGSGLLVNFVFARRILFKPGE